MLVAFEVSNAVKENTQENTQDFVASTFLQVLY